MQRQLLTMLAVAVLSAPVGAATWYGFGTYEPDTAYDLQGGFQRSAPDVSTSGKDLYFNAYQSEYLTGQNANVGTAGTRITVPGAQQYMAMFGAWKDCNGDGYVGLAESALLVYPSTVLGAFTASICPAGSFHNDGQWVWEYVPVGYQEETPEDLHPRQIVDPASRVWGDFGLPGDTAAATCPIAPPPHGTTSGTGWAIRYADCFASKRITGTVNSADPDDALGLRFDDDNNPQQSDSLLNQQLPESLFGNPETDETGFLQLDSDEDHPDYDGSYHPERREPAFTTWDCSANALEVRDPTGALPTVIAAGGFDQNLTDEEGRYAWFATPAPTLHDPTDSYADGLNETFRGFHVGGRDDQEVISAEGNSVEEVEVGGDCNTEEESDTDADGDNTYAEIHQTAFFYADGNNEGNTQVAAKNKIDVQFQYTNGAGTDETLAPHLGPNAPNSVVSTPTTYYTNDPNWQAGIVYVTPPQSINRATLQPAGPAYATFYAKVGGTTLAAGWRAPHVGAKYGAESCGLNTSGQHGGWECDPAQWYLDATGNDIADPNWDVRVGETYQFRDIDCNDGHVARGSGVYASLVILSPGYGGDTDHVTCRDAP